MANGGKLRFFGGMVNAAAPAVKPACETCRFFVESFRLDCKGWGQCRRGHPRVACYTQGWPNVGFDDWCGEYEEAAQAVK